MLCLLIEQFVSSSNIENFVEFAELILIVGSDTRVFALIGLRQIVSILQQFNYNNH